MFMNSLSIDTTDDISGPLCTAWLQLAEQSLGQRSFASLTATAAPPVPTERSWLVGLLPRLCELLGVEAAELVRKSGPRWSSVAHCGPGPSLLGQLDVQTLVSDAVDGAAATVRQRWLAVAVDRP